MLKVLDHALAALATVLFVLVGWRWITQGWLAIQDYYLLVGALLAAIVRILPDIIKINVSLAFAMLAGIEFGSGLIAQKSGAPVVEEERVSDDPAKPHRISDDVIGYRPASDSSTRHYKRVGGRYIFDVHYRIDEYGRRSVPQTRTGCRNEHLLFFGGSNTFGFGVEAEDTLPARVAARTPGMRTYNYAYGGYGPQHMLARLADTAIEEEIGEQTGQAVYLYIDDHIKRAISTMRTHWVHRSPFYELTENGSVRRNGNFNKARPVVYRLYHDFLLRSAVLSKLHIDIPFRINESHVYLTAKLIEAASYTYKQKFANGAFTTVLLPQKISPDGTALTEALRDLDVQVLNYQGKGSDEFKIDPVYESHLSSKGHEATAHWIAKDLALSTEDCQAPSAEN